MKNVAYRSATILAIALQGISANHSGFSQSFDHAAIPEACAKEVTPSTGKPYMFPRKGSLQFGLSSRPSPLRDKVPLVIWVSNPTDKEEAVMSCEDLEFFFVDGFDLLDQDGIRVMSNLERKAPLALTFRKCLRNSPIPIPPHSCVHGDFEKPTPDFVKNLGDYYVLHPGDYTITPAALEQRGRRPATGLAVEVIP